MSEGFKDRMRQSSMRDKAIPKDDAWSKLQNRLNKHSKRKGKLPYGFLIVTMILVVLVLILAILIIYYGEIKSKPTHSDIEIQTAIDTLRAQPDSVNQILHPQN